MGKIKTDNDLKINVLLNSDKSYSITILSEVLKNNKIFRNPFK